MSSSKAIDIKQGKKDDSFQIEINLLYQNLEEVFIRMCYDLLKYLEDATDEKSALKSLNNVTISGKIYFKTGDEKSR